MRRQVLLLTLAATVSGTIACRATPPTPLALAAARGDVAAVRALLAEGGRPNGADPDGRWQAAVWAARVGQIAALEAILRAGIDPAAGPRVLDRRDPDGNGWTAIMHAIHTNQIASVRTLLAHGANPNAGTRDGFTPLMMAAGYGYDHIVRALLAAGANPRARTSGGVDALALAVGGVPDIDRFTVGTCQPATVRALLEAAPDLALPNTAGGRTARWVAKHIGRCDNVMSLLEGRGRGTGPG